MKKYFLLTIILTAIISVSVYGKLFQPRINIGGFVKYQVITTQDGVYPKSVSAFGVLKLHENQPEEVNQVFKIDLIDKKLVMSEGSVSKDGTIVMPSNKILDVVSINSTEMIAKDDVWTVIITRNSVILTDKDGKGGKLVGGFVGDFENDLSQL